MDSYLYVLI